MESATVVSKTISDFRNHCFEDGDKFRYAVIVPQSTLSNLDDTEEYEYVEISSPDSDAEATLAQIIAFSDAHDPEEFSTDDGLPWACIRTKLQREIGLDPERDEVAIRIDPERCYSWDFTERMRDACDEGR